MGDRSVDRVRKFPKKGGSDSDELPEQLRVLGDFYVKIKPHKCA